MNPRLTGTLLIALVLATALQAALPTWWWAGGLRLELLPAVVAYGALTMRSPRWAVTCAFLAGFAQDALSAAPFGLTALGYGLGALVLAKWQDELERDLPWIQFAAGGFVLVCGTLGVLPAMTLTWGTPLKIACLMCLSAFVTPFVFALLDGVQKEARE
jgi:rod shape-determining protein MreD